ncbi:MAG: hypothetical protein ACKVRP_05525 [Bacteroidota bacterium]
MKLIIGLVVFCVSIPAFGGDIVVQRVRGNVSVRQGVAEDWIMLKTGDVLNPDATIKTDIKASTELATTHKSGTRKFIKLPGEVMVDMSDIRELSQEELMLKLTMEKVRSSSYQWKNNEMRIPNTTVTHGSDTRRDTLTENDPKVGMFLLNGTRALFDNGFYSTCALKTLEIFRRYPKLGEQFEHRWLAAEALEMAHLRGEALNEYLSLSAMEGITTDQQTQARGKVEELRKVNGR